MTLEGNKRKWLAALNRALPAIYFLFVFFLYYSMLSMPYFTDEQDVFYGAYSVAKGRDIYNSFLSQHMPFSYYFTAPLALIGARTVFQFRLGTYFLLALLWEGIFLRHRKRVSPVSLFAMPLLYLAILKTQSMGGTMLSDHWQGIGLVMIMLEMLRYMDTKEIPLSCALTVSLAILLSFGSTFAAAYSLFAYFLGVAAIQIGLLRKAAGQGGEGAALLRKKVLREDLRLVLLCVLPFALLLGWYALTGNVANFFSGAYEIVTQVYVKYSGGLGSDPVGVIWETVFHFVESLGEAAGNLAKAPGVSLARLAVAAGFLLFCVQLGRRSPAAGLAVFFATVYGGLRSFEGFHAMAYFAQSTAAVALLWGTVLKKCEAGGRLKIPARTLTGAAGLALSVHFLIWGGYNLLYPQILLNRTLRTEERILDLLTDPEEEVHSCNQPVNSLDLMDLELIPSDACGAVSYPYYYEVWGGRQMESIRRMPHTVLYNPEEVSWGKVFREYAPDFDAFVNEHYVRLPQAEDLWVSREFYPEASRRLKEAGYGDRMISNVKEITANHPVEYGAGQSIRSRFTAGGEKLSAVRICAACFHRRSRPYLTLRVRDPETGEILGEGGMGPEDLADTFFSRCPLQARLIPGREYELEIAVDRVEGKGDMELYFTPEGDLALAAEYFPGQKEGQGL